MPAPKALTRGRDDQRGSDDEPIRGIERGDWLDVHGVGLCCVVRVHRDGRHMRVDVERASDLRQRTIDLRRRRWRRVER
ncbi:MAG TPA: hypothetical protein ENI87_15605 [bacterium]|nr:hypothetical protein [bacterium]